MLTCPCRRPNFFPKKLLPMSLERFVTYVLGLYRILSRDREGAVGNVIFKQSSQSIICSLQHIICMTYYKSEVGS